MLNYGQHVIDPAHQTLGILLDFFQSQFFDDAYGGLTPRNAPTNHFLVEKSFFALYEKIDRLN